jgi:alpha-ketoglutarate-dependent taurine dioxygenase
MINVNPFQPDHQQQVGDACFPLALRCDTAGIDVDQASQWIVAQREELDRLANLHGAILFRDFPLRTPEDFDRFVSAFAFPNFKYEESLSNAVRIVRTPRVFSANEAPAEVTIYLHHEMAQTPIYPSKLLFFCEVAAETGGATPICRSDLLYEELRTQAPEFIADCEAKGLRYTNVMPNADDAASGMGRSWQSTLRVTDRAAAEAQLSKLGYRWAWLEDGCLQATTGVLPAVRDLGDGRKSFFNQLIAASQGWKDARNDPSKAITFGDGSRLDAGAVRLAANLAEALTFDIVWHPGDVAMVDNYVAMHARRTFTGKRKVWASLVAGESILNSD